MKQFAGALLLGSLSIGGVIPASADTLTWIGGNDTWSLVDGWTPPGPPGSTDDAVVGSSAGSEIIRITQTAEAQSISLTERSDGRIGDELVLEDGVGLTFWGGGFVNDGKFSQQANSSETVVEFVGDQTVSGHGVWTLSDSSQNVVKGNGAKITHALEHTISGAGQLGDSSLSFDNRGTILANGAQPLVIDTNSSGFEQNGVLKAQGSGGLVVFGSSMSLNNPLEVEAGSKVSIELSSISGAVEVADGAAAEISGSTLRGLTVAGTIVQPDATTNTFREGLTNNGVWRLTSQSDHAVMRFTAPQTLDGEGRIEMGETQMGRIEGSGELTIGANQTISGAGQLGDSGMSIVNRGTIQANSQSNALILDASGNGFSNEGVIEVVGAGGLVSRGDLTQTAGTTRVESTLTLQAGEFELQGGVLSGSGRVAGNVTQTGGVINAGNSPGALTIAGELDLDERAELQIEIAGRGAGEFDVLVVEGTAFLDGTISAVLLGMPQIDIGDTFDVLVANLISGEFGNTTVEAGLAIFDIAYVDGVQDVVQLTAIQASPIPLPAAAWLLISGLVALAGGRRLAR